MFNRERTKELFGYDLDLSVTRRTKKEIEQSNGVVRKHLKVVDNCPICNIERIILLRQSRKNKPCSKCFHNLPTTIAAKRNQTKFVSEETKQKMRDNHWSKNGGVSAFKGKKHTEDTKNKLRLHRQRQCLNYTDEQLKQFHIKASCTVRNISIEDFDGFSSPKNTLIRQSAEGKQWRIDVMAKANFTCDNCNVRGKSLVAHHLEAFHCNPELRFDINNGVCLCRDCHAEFHTQYGKRNNTKIQYEEFHCKNKS